MWRRPLALSVSTAALFAASSLVAPDAHANGRFPASNAVFFSPKDPDTQFVRVTFGLLGTRDAGKHWGWVCERAIGFSGLEDPTYDGVLASNFGVTVGEAGSTMVRFNISPAQGVPSGEWAEG